MRARFMAVMFGGLCLMAGASAEPIWDGVALVPGYVSEGGVSYQVCPASTHLSLGMQKGCVNGTWAPKKHGDPAPMSLQVALDLHFRPAAGLRAVAVGPLPAFDRGGLDLSKFGIAYKLVKAK